MAAPRTKTHHRLCANDVGTLWTMMRHDLRARCALISNEEDWEVRVVVDDATLCAESCDSAELAFKLATRWKALMAERGWRDVMPARKRLAHTASDAGATLL
jgi:hypothetical protein